MPPAPPPLPTRFPCWCRAVYSWGGESKRDLGFIEGDLIECLNAGDGSWWVGRLYRDRRSVGSFPSNFVELLPDTFRPTTKSVSPLPETPSPKNVPAKSKTFRKPFEAYAKAPHYTTAKQPVTYREGFNEANATIKGTVKGTHRENSTAGKPRDNSTRGRPRDNSAASFANTSIHDHSSRAPSPAPPMPHSYTSRAPSPAVLQDYTTRSVSPAPPQTLVRYGTRAISPAPPPQRHDYGARGTSPAPPIQTLTRYSTRPVSPAPPQHIHSHSYSSRAPSPLPPQHTHSHSYDSRAPSPAPLQHTHSRSYDPRAPSPAPLQQVHSRSYDPRAPSPAPLQQTHSHSYDPRAPSPAPLQHTNSHSYDSRAPSPAPPQHPRNYVPRAPSPAPSFSRTPSFNAEAQRNDSPPPPPPPHRHVIRTESKEFTNTAYDLSRHDSNSGYAPYNPYAMSRHNSNASYMDQAALSRQGSHISHINRPYEPRTTAPQTPRAPSVSPQPSPSNMTPSPLREAMDGVMEQLDELRGRGGADARQSPDPPLNPWSPECFEMVGGSKRKRQHPRPLTSTGIAHSDEGYETRSGASSQETSYQNGAREKGNGLPQLNNYVERMEKRLQKMHQHSSSTPAATFDSDVPPPPPPKGQTFERPKSSMGSSDTVMPDRKLRARKSAYEVGVSRTYTTKTNSTEASSGNQSQVSASTQSSGRTLWSGVSASGFSSTSAGSLARGNQQRAHSAFGMRDASDMDRPETPFTGVTYHSSHASNAQATSRPPSQAGLHDDPAAGLGGLVQPKAPKRSIFKKIFESAKTGVASSRDNIAAGTFDAGKTPAKSSPFSGKSSPFSRSKPAVSSSMAGMGNPQLVRDTAREMGLSNGVDWVQVRRDVNRSNSLSKKEMTDRAERCQMMDHPTLNPVDELYEGIEGDEGADGMPVQTHIDYQSINLSQVDKNSRFISGLPPMTTAITLATSYVCRPYRSDVQRLRAIFIWVAEKITWEEDFEGEIDTTQVIQDKRACAEEYAILVMEMCNAIGIHCEVVRGYLKRPGEVTDLNMMPRSNHWWNAVVIDNEWRIIDCCLASQSNPRRGNYSNVANNIADPWWFLARPLEVCWTHVPEHHDQQHIVPPVAHETLLNLPCTTPAFFRQGVEMVDYNTCLTRIEDLEMVHIKFNVPADVEVAAEVEARAYSRDSDGDLFESGDLLKKPALAQAEWFNGVKRYTVKALLPGDEGQGVLNIYAGKRGLMHSVKDIPHPLAFALPIIHTGENPPYDFVMRHPTPHAQRHDIYVVQPQCKRLALNNTFVFAIRQHPSSLTPGPQSALTPSSNPGGASPVSFLRPGSSMSMNASISGTGSNPSSASGTVAGKKPAKLAIQTPGGKILRLMRKEDRKGISVGSRGLSSDEDISDGGTWETIIKCSEKGVWRGLVLADRTARWCVFAEWVCVG